MEVEAGPELGQDVVVRLRAKAASHGLDSRDDANQVDGTTFFDRKCSKALAFPQFRLEELFATY
jgi:hypothetical protein